MLLVRKWLQNIISHWPVYQTYLELAIMLKEVGWLRKWVLRVQIVLPLETIETWTIPAIPWRNICLCWLLRSDTASINYQEIMLGYSDSNKDLVVTCLLAGSLQGSAAWQLSVINLAWKSPSSMAGRYSVGGGPTYEAITAPLQHHSVTGSVWLSKGKSLVQIWKQRRSLL